MTISERTQDYREYLNGLGERVRKRRLDKKMSRRALSKDSGVSERFIAHLELGEGNISILKLKAIADALNVSVTEIVADHTRDTFSEPPPDDWRAHPSAIAELFRHADPDHQKAVVELLVSATRRRRAA